MDASRLDAVVVGAGPNGLAAAVALARAGYSVGVLEGSPKLGGGCRTAELTLPGFKHDVCAAVHPIGRASPFLNRLPLEQHGLTWLHPELPLAHPFDDGSAAELRRDLGETAAGLGADGPGYQDLFGPIVSDWPQLLPAILGPLRIPRHPLVMARFGLPALRSVAGLCRSQFKGEHARALLAGISAHALV
ncbi:MAG: NAD(P)/FAD-dependent oxidoreductase, partial [Myxococcales bacterium]